MKINSSFFNFFFFLLTGLDQLDWLIGLDHVMNVVEMFHLLLEIGNGQGTDCFGQFAKEIGGKVVLVPLHLW